MFCLCTLSAWVFLRIRVCMVVENGEFLCVYVEVGVVCKSKY